MTERLYYKDSHLWEFDARVLSCEPLGEGFALALDRTAFFPEGGGQPGDAGTIDGITVTDVRERGDEVAHYIEASFAVGATVHGALDKAERLRRMRNHTGEHIVSGFMHELFGYSNVGFHMDAKGCTFDFDGELTEEDVALVERLANEAVWSNAAIKTYFPTSEELKHISYRSKKELEGQVRIVEIEGYDVCACCAPHVKATGEIGMIKLMDVMRHRGGTRMTALCGADALCDYRARCENVAVVSHALSAPALETGAAAQRLLSEYEKAKRTISYQGRELALLRAELIAPTEGSACFFAEDMDMVSLRELVNTVMEKSRLCAAFTGAEGEYKYIIGSKALDLRALSREINAAIKGQGGGRETMLQGTSGALRADIEAYFKNI